MKMQTKMNKLASAIANREGKKHQASIGDIREILKIIVDFEAGSLMDLDDASPCKTMREASMEFARTLGYLGGNGAKQGTAKVSKENKIKAGRDRKTKRAGKSDRGTNAKARK